MWDCCLNIKCGSLSTAELEQGPGMHPGLDLGRNRERTEESNSASEVEIRNQDPRMSPSQGSRHSVWCESKIQVQKGANTPDWVMET